jgi:uncharacterized protein YeaO (DUF488 family)
MARPKRGAIRLKRIYDPPASDDGLRVLVDRLWPRGVRREEAAIDAWMPELAPSATLRKWFGHDPARWDDFKRRFFEELDGRPEAVEAIVSLIGGRRATLLFAARDSERNNAVALQAYLQGRHQL